MSNAVDFGVDVLMQRDSVLCLSKSIGRCGSWDTVGHSAGTYRNRMQVRFDETKELRSPD